MNVSIEALRDRLGYSDARSPEPAVAVPSNTVTSNSYAMSGKVSIIQEPSAVGIEITTNPIGALSGSGDISISPGKLIAHVGLCVGSKEGATVGGGVGTPQYRYVPSPPSFKLSQSVRESKNSKQNPLSAIIHVVHTPQENAGELVGVMEGAGVGDALGDVLGDNVGPYVGSWVGVIVGPDVGAVVGFIVGPDVGVDVGPLVGPGVGGRWQARSVISG